MSDLQETLRELHRELGEARRLAPEERALLEATIEDIRQALAQTAPDTVADTASASPAEALEGVAVRLEAEHPGVAGAVRALVDALAKAGI